MLSVRVTTAAAWLLGLLFIALHLQHISASGHLVDSAAGGGAKAYHLGLALTALVVVARGRVLRWPLELRAYVGGMALLTLLLALATSPQRILANAVVAILALVVGTTLGEQAGRAMALRALRGGAWLLLVAVLVKAVVYRDAILLFLLVPSGHPVLPTFAGGGPNLEATWVALAAALFLGTRGLVPYAALSALLSALYASRVGLLATAFVLAVAWIGLAPRARWRWLLWGAALLGGAVAALALLTGELPGVGYVVDRFQDIGDDPGSTSRLALWQGAGQVFADHPVGVGLGNALPAVRVRTGVGFTEDNLHNLYLQHLVETGVLGAALFGAFALVTVGRLHARRWRDPLLVYVVGYFGLAWLQFRGWEPLPWLVYGLWLGTDRGRQGGERQHGPAPQVTALTSAST